MPVQFRCHQCGTRLGISSRKIGATINCPACNAELVVPEQDSPDQPVPVAAAPQVSPEPPPPPPVWFGDEAEGDEEAPLFSGEKKEDEGMDLTPMVDVTFLLLIFFMITASFSLQKALQVPPPDPEETGAAVQLVQSENLQEEAIMVTVTAANQVLVDDVPVGDLGELQTIFENKIRTDDKNEIVIAASEKSLHETVVAVVDAANGAQMQRIRMATTTEDD